MPYVATQVSSVRGDQVLQECSSDFKGARVPKITFSDPHILVRILRNECQTTPQSSHTTHQ